MKDITKDFLIDYKNADSMYLCDAISEFANERVSIYYSDIMNFIKDNVDAVNDAIKEFGWDGCGGDLHKAGQTAEFMKNENDIYDDLRKFDSNATIEELKEDQDFKDLIAEAES